MLFFHPDIFVMLCLFQGDSGGPLWVREKEGKTLPIAHLVSKIRLREALILKKKNGKKGDIVH